MSDFRVEVKVKNAHLYNAIIDAGYVSVNSFCIINNLSASMVGRYINLKESPLKEIPKSSSDIWKDYALKLADLLYKDPEDLWPDEVKDIVLDTNFSYKNMGVEKVKQLLSNYEEVSVPLIASPDIIQENNELKDLINGILGTLAPREAYVVERRFGLNGHSEMTLQAIADELGVGQERVRQIEAKALRKLRHPGHVEEHLGDHIDEYSKNE